MMLIPYIFDYYANKTKFKKSDKFVEEFATVWENYDYKGYSDYKERVKKYLSTDFYKESFGDEEGDGQYTELITRLKIQKTFSLQEIKTKEKKSSSEFTYQITAKNTTKENAKTSTGESIINIQISKSNEGFIVTDLEVISDNKN